jgi:hypothetical protein
MQKLGRFGAFSPRRRRLLLPGPLRCFSNIASNVRMMCPRCIGWIWMGHGVLLGRCQKHTDAVRRKHPSRAILWGSILAARCGVWRSKVWFDDVLVYGFCRWRVEVDWPTVRDTAFYIFFHSLIITGSVGPSRISNGSPTRWRRWGTWRWAQMFVAGRTVLLLCSCDLAQRRSWQSDRVED